MSDNIALSDMIRIGRASGGKRRKFGPVGPSERLEDALAGASDAAEASENAARRRLSEGSPAPLARLGAGLRSAAPEAPGPSDPKRRSPPIRGRAEASASDASGSRRGGAPSPAPPEFAGAAAAGARGEAGSHRSRRAGSAGLGGAPARHAKAAEDQAPALAVGSNAPALPAPVGADGSPTPADADAPSDPKRGPHGGVRDGAEGRKPEGAALETQAPGANPPALLPSAGRLSGRLAALAETAKAYARAAQADNTQRAYAADWRKFASWLRRQGLAETPPDPEAVGLYLASQVERGGAELSVSTLERRLSGIAWRYRQLGQPLEIRDRHIATVLAGIRRRHARPPLQKAAIFADELLAMLAVLDMDLRGLRDRAILAIGFAGGLRRSEIVGLDCGPGQTEDGSGWIEIFPEGALLTIRGKTGWREVEIGRGSRADTCPVALLETWLRLGRNRPWSPVPGDRPQERRGFRGAADRQACRPAGEDMRPRRRLARRPGRGRAAARVRRPFAARRPRLLRPDRGGPRPETSRPRQRRNDPPLSAQARPVHDQPHKGGGAVATGRGKARRSDWAV